MGNCLESIGEPRYYIYLYLTNTTWPEPWVIDQIKRLLASRKITRLIIGCRTEICVNYWRNSLTNSWGANRVEYVVNALLKPDDYLLVLDQARPILTRCKKRLHVLVPSDFKRQSWVSTASAFFEHYPKEEWQIVHRYLTL